MFWMMLGVFVPILLLGFVFARRQDRITRAMAEMEQPSPETGYVGPHRPGLS
ncbi:hypothetical protein [Deinococcus ficus]|uniref:hypothetical protein n=1 Tax=Deinococcus ficus TaxID=317577 RepID=UPI0003B75A3C|nr:hypothetical protein [Deinococcus ficus]